jgi:hypothetical protein
MLRGSKTPFSIEMHWKPFLFIWNLSHDCYALHIAAIVCYYYIHNVLRVNKPPWLLGWKLCRDSTRQCTFSPSCLLVCFLSLPPFHLYLIPHLHHNLLLVTACVNHRSVALRSTPNFSSLISRKHVSSSRPIALVLLSEACREDQLCYLGVD